MSNIKALKIETSPELDCEKTLTELLVDPTKKLLPPQPLWVQAKEQNPDDECIMGTMGNFSMVIGKAKSRKSFFLNIVVCVVLGKRIGNFAGKLQGKKILFFDTEQGQYHLQLATKRICHRIGVENPSSLLVYGLRSKTPAERLQLIEWAIENIPDIGLVIIDGIKDLITSINDESEATMIASKLLKWTEEKAMHVINVLHQNKSDNNARGHLGTELINKAETVLSVTKADGNNEISIVQAEQCRNREPKPFAFEIVDGLPELVEDYEFRTQTNKKSADVTELEDFKVFGLLNEVYSHGKEFGYKDLETQIKLASKKLFKKEFGNNQVTKLITMAKNKEFLIQEKKRSPYTLGKFNEGVKEIKF